MPPPCGRLRSSPEAAPERSGAGAGPLRSRFPSPRLTARSPVAPCGGRAGPLGAPGCTLPAASPWETPGAGAWTSSRPSAPPAAASVCARRPGSAAPARAARARAGRGGSEAGLSPARRGAASLLRRRSLLPPPPPSRSLVLAGAAQTCSGAAAPARIRSGLRPRDRRRGRGEAPRRAGLHSAARCGSMG
ncbi:hypothetical protein VULLAG_LOCUS19374 [Vulpes lagopus]